MTSSSVRMNQQHGTFANRIGNKSESLPVRSSAPKSRPSHSFVAVLLKALSAFAG